MKKLLLLIFVISQVYGCGASLKSYPDAKELFPDGQTLWKVRIGRGDSQLFAGLLAINKKDKGLVCGEVHGGQV